MTPNRPSHSYYLVWDITDCAPEVFKSAVLVAPAASVLFSPICVRSVTDSAIRLLVNAAQSEGIAALIADDITLARAVRADGVHLSAGADLMERYAEARRILGKDAIVGVDAGGSRHLAMEAGEAGADYVAFSDVRIAADDLLTTGRESAEEDSNLSSLADTTANATSVVSASDAMSKAELIAWWSEIFEVPCVALDGKGPDDLRTLIDSGADFIGVTVKEGVSTAEIASLLAVLRSV